MSLVSVIRSLFGRASDARGQALDTMQTAAEPTGGRAMVGQLARELAEHPSRGLTPAALYAILEEAEQGQLRRQHEMAADMEEKDPQIQSDLSKRRQAAIELDWSIVPPPDPTPAEQRATDQAQEVMAGIEVEDLLVDLGDGLLHGWVNLTIPWQTDGTARVVGQPVWVPHAHFQIHPDDQNQLTLRDGSITGEALWPLGWVEHRHRAKSGYVARMGLLRVLAWPYLFQNYALGDLAELLEILGIPLRLGKYPSTATANEKNTLLRALTALGHSAAGIIPQSMQIELLQAASGSEKPFETMLQWCERSKSKAILGGTLTTGTDQGSGAYALGSVHERGLLSLVAADCRQYTASIRRYLLWPMAALNYAITDLRRAPRLVIETGDPADLKVLAESLPTLVGLGMRITPQWLHERTQIPLAGQDEPVLSATPAPEQTPPPAAALRARSEVRGARNESGDPLTSHFSLLTSHSSLPPDYADQHTAALSRAAAPAMSALLAPIRAELDAALSEGLDLAALGERLLTLYPRLPAGDLTAVLGEALAAAELAGRYDVREGG